MDRVDVDEQASRRDVIASGFEHAHVVAVGAVDRPADRHAVAVDSDGHVYVVEGLHDTVQIFGDDGRFLLAFGESGAGDGQFWLPAGIAIHDDFIYVADAANRRVQVFKYLKESR